MPTPKITPTKNYVLVLRDPEESVSKGGIIIPDAHKDLARTGTVQAIGKDIKECKEGDRVLFIWSAGFDIKSDGVAYNTLLLMKESDILGVIEGEGPVELNGGRPS